MRRRLFFGGGFFYKMGLEERAGMVYHSSKVVGIQIIFCLRC